MPYTSRSDARESECPACGAGAGEKCVGARNKTRESVHRERMQRAARELHHAEVRTLTVDGDRLVAADGTVMGRIVGMEIDIQADQWETVAGNLRRGEEEGLVVDVPRSEAKEETNTRGAGVPEQTELEGQLFDAPSPEMVVWQYWLRASGRNQRFDATQKGVVRNALKARTPEQCCEAIDGLLNDPWWRDNRPRLELRYALRGNHQKGESDEDRIDRMRQKRRTVSDGPTTLSSLMGHVPSDRHWIIEGRADDVRRAISNGHRDEGAEQFVRQHAKAEPVIEDGKMKGWRRVG